MENCSKIESNAFIYRFTKAVINSIFISLILATVIGVISSAVSAFIYTVLITFIIQVVFKAGLIILESQNLGYKVEKNSVSFREGIFSISSITVPFIKITNVSFQQSLFQRLFSVGDLLIDQEDSNYTWDAVDKKSADIVIKEISSKSNIQPISH